jgi:hypothetical protein
MVHRVFIDYGAQALVAKGLKSFKEFPIRQKPASFNLGRSNAKAVAIGGVRLSGAFSPTAYEFSALRDSIGSGAWRKRIFEE